MAGNGSKAGRIHRRADGALIAQAPNRNALWGALAVEELVRQGVTLFFAAPGSRSTPLTLAAAAHPRAELVMHFDERGLAFAALGAGRAGRPAAVITTSGTAVANLLPAVVEASLDHLPLILLTADRPSELRDTGANQTIDQVGIFGRYVRWSADLSSPQEPVHARVLLTAIGQAASRARTAPCGPVHLNLPLREPLAPQAEEFDRSSLMAGLGDWLSSARPFTEYLTAGVPDGGALRRLARVLSRGPGVLVAGALATDGERAAVLALARRLRWSILADVLSGLRHRRDRMIVRHADLLLASAPQAAALRPRVILHVGGRLVSRRVQEWMQTSGARVQARIHPAPDRLDPGHTVTHRLAAPVATTCAALARICRTAGPVSYRAAWCAADARVGRLLSRSDLCTESAAARVLSGLLPREAALVLASSMPVRDAEQCAGRTPARVFANRGASGIDGTVATTAGIACAAPGPVALLLGDLSLLHDLNSLALLRQVKRPLVILCINNDGGGIFGLLPVAAFPAHFERCFGTPHGLTFADAAHLFGLPYRAPAQPVALAREIARALRRSGATLIEVSARRADRAPAHHDLLSRVRALFASEP